MTSPWHDIEGKAEEVVSNYLQACLGTELTGWTVVEGFATSVPEPPMLAIFATEADPEEVGAQYSGNHVVTVQIVVRTHLDSGPAAHREMVGLIRDQLFTEDPLADQLNAVTGRSCTVFRAAPQASLRQVVGDASLMAETIIPVALYMAPSVL
jgi:hypothetical protein